MIFIRQPQRRQAPSVLQVGVEREAVVFNRQRCPVAENLHGAVEVLSEGRFEVLAPTRRIGREAAESKTDWREIKPRIKSASAAEADFLRIEFVEAEQHPAHRDALVVVYPTLQVPRCNS